MCPWFQRSAFTLRERIPADSSPLVQARKVMCLCVCVSKHDVGQSSNENGLYLQSLFFSWNQSRVLDVILCSARMAGFAWIQALHLLEAVWESLSVARFQTWVCPPNMRCLLGPTRLKPVKRIESVIRRGSSNRNWDIEWYVRYGLSRYPNVKYVRYGSILMLGMGQTWNFKT